MCRLYDACKMWIYDDQIENTEKCTLISQVGNEKMYPDIPRYGVRRCTLISLGME
jgi:hypothetical protein